MLFQKILTTCAVHNGLRTFLLTVEKFSTYELFPNPWFRAKISPKKGSDPNEYTHG